MGDTPMQQLKQKLEEELDLARSCERTYRLQAEEAEKKLQQLDEEWVDIGDMPALSGVEKPEVIVRARPASRAKAARAAA